jgi:hypothetical protein
MRTDFCRPSGLLVMAVLAGCSRSPTTPAGTGAREAAQGYYEAIIHRDWPKAYAALDPECTKGLTLDQFTRMGEAWAYHFSNGVTFGVMYVALIGDARRRSWLWAVLLATGLEMGMLLTPYPQFVAIPLTAVFVGVTFMAHLVFGVALGLVTRWWSKRNLQPLAAS